MKASDKIAIPEHHQEFCRAVGKLARAHGLNSFSGSFDPSFDDPWPSRIGFSWEQGRHGEDSDRISISSSCTVNTKIGPDKPTLY